LNNNFIKIPQTNDFSESLMLDANTATHSYMVNRVPHLKVTGLHVTEADLTVGQTVVIHDHLNKWGKEQ